MRLVGQAGRAHRHGAIRVRGVKVPRQQVDSLAVAPLLDEPGSKPMQ
jgi:hypothetical protein